MPKEPAGGGVVGPDLLLVIEGRLSLRTRHDHRRLPAVLAKHRGGSRVVQARGSDTNESVEDRVGEGELDLGAECGRQVRVVDALTITPRKRPVAARDRPDGHGGIAKRHELVLVVPGQGVDGTGVTFTGGQRIAVGGGPTRVGGLRPVVTRVEREINTGYTDPGGSVQTCPTVYGEWLRAGLLVDKVIRPCHEDIRRVRIQGNRRLVLMVLRSIARRAADADAA